MAISLPDKLIEFVLLGPFDDRRQLQDSPILGDVWVRFGEKPEIRHDLLIAPFKGEHAGDVANILSRELDPLHDSDASPAVGDDSSPPPDHLRISYLQALIAARLTFEEVLVHVVPRTKWWSDMNRAIAGSASKRRLPPGRSKAPKQPGRLEQYQLPDKVEEKLRHVLGIAKKTFAKDPSTDRVQEISPLNRFAVLAAMILWARKTDVTINKNDSELQQIAFVIDRLLADAGEAATLLVAVVKAMFKIEIPKTSLVWSVSLNRQPLYALGRSVPAVKADAATTLFKVNCSNIGWAVLDSGIDGSHPAFYTTDGSELRVIRTFDFRNYRQIVSLGNLNAQRRKEALGTLIHRDLLQRPITPDADLAELAKGARNRSPVRWELVERFVEIKPDTRPTTNHGTHVAGILGANRQAALHHANGVASDDFADGMCPDIQLYDFRVLGDTEKDTEFAIIAALQFIRFLNERNSLATIHGANLSLSIRHDVRNFACGNTPICDECERLVENGVVVVAAAGNHGYKRYATSDGNFDNYAAFSITDPGNAESVLTVGSTHRFWPHTYGVSFFSSRGPTGDGRVKPDLVAPGERIRAPLPGGEWGDLDGTSMAAPHVSGAAAMLMARYSELIGRPRRIKQILCDSATDLGREKHFQGRGMLDVLRAFQLI